MNTRDHYDDAGANECHDEFEFTDSAGDFYDDDDDDADRQPFDDEEALDRAIAERERAEERKAFGAECRRMANLLRVHGLDATFETAKHWVRLFEDSDVARATFRAAPWLEEGWWDVDKLVWVVLHEDDAKRATQRFAEIGTTIEAVQRPEVDPASILNGEEPPPGAGDNAART